MKQALLRNLRNACKKEDMAVEGCPIVYDANTGAGQSGDELSWFSMEAPALR